MIEKKTIVDQIEVVRSGHIQIRLGLLLIEDGKEIDCKWHRTSVEPGGDVDAQFKLVNAHLSQMGKAQVPSTELDLVKSVAGVVHTPAAVAKFRSARKPI